MHVHWFNPENDLALAAATPNFTPPKSAKLIHDAGALLPIWYAHKGDSVLCYGVNAAWFDSVRRDFDIDVDVFDHDPTARTFPDPWGWSAYAKRFFADEGFLPDTLPTDDSIAAMRALSHRRTASTLAADLAMRLPDLPIGGAAMEVYDIDDVAAILSDNKGHYLKHPWSSSGRGVMCTTDMPLDRTLKFADDSIRRQGSIMVERAYDKSIDFACLYQCADGKCTAIGTSVFTTDDRGTYTGNVIASESVRRDMVCRYCPAQTLDAVYEALRDLIEAWVAPAYDGVVGVDMLIDKDGTLAVMEINLRKTMGYVAARFSDMYLSDGASGIFRVTPIRDVSVQQSRYDLAGHRLASGILSLTPPGYPFSFVVEIDN